MSMPTDRDALPANKSQNQIEQDALLAVARALPMGVRPVLLADRGFHRAGFLACLVSATGSITCYASRRAAA